MIQSRIREIRKLKKLTLQQVADKSETTAQTIGRLETGMRTLSVDWVNRIAKALDVDPSELLALPESGDIVISGFLHGGGIIEKKDAGTIALRLLAQAPIALKVTSNTGQYREGDTIIFDSLPGTDPHSNIGKDCLVEDSNGHRHFGKVIFFDESGVTISPVGQEGTIASSIENINIAPAIMLMRNL